MSNNGGENAQKGFNYQKLIYLYLLVCENELGIKYDHIYYESKKSDIFIEQKKSKKNHYVEVTLNKEFSCGINDPKILNTINNYLKNDEFNSESKLIFYVETIKDKRSNYPIDSNNFKLCSNFFEDLQTKLDENPNKNQRSIQETIKSENAYSKFENLIDNIYIINLTEDDAKKKCVDKIKTYEGVKSSFGEYHLEDVYNRVRVHNQFNNTWLKYSNEDLKSYIDAKYLDKIGIKNIRNINLYSENNFVIKLKKITNSDRLISNAILGYINYKYYNYECNSLKILHKIEKNDNTIIKCHNVKYNYKSPNLEEEYEYFVDLIDDTLNDYNIIKYNLGNIHYCSEEDTIRWQSVTYTKEVNE